MAAADEFNEIVEGITTPIMVSITQRDEEYTANYDFDGTDDLDLVIATTVKGLFAMCLDAMGFWEGDFDDDDDDDDDDDPLSPA